MMSENIRYRHNQNKINIIYRSLNNVKTKFILKNINNILSKNTRFRAYENIAFSRDLEYILFTH